MASPGVSIIMPVYNEETWLAESLDSLLSQTYNDWELITVDDGSRDRSATLLESYARKDSRIRVLQGAHHGIVKSLNRACAEAKTPFLARMDADDIARPERLEIQLRLFQENPQLDLCGTCVQLEGPSRASGTERYERWINSLLCHDDIYKERFVECPLPHPTFMMKRSLFIALGGYREGPFPEDYDFFLRAAMQGAGFGKTMEQLLLWREHDKRLSRQDERYGLKAFRALKRIYLPVADAKKSGKAFYQWGAGEVGKAWLQEWAEAPEAVVDINPRKIGKHIHGVHVIREDELPPPGQCFIVVAVGTPGARDDIRSRLTPRGYQEGTDFLFVA